MSRFRSPHSFVVRMCVAITLFTVADISKSAHTFANETTRRWEFNRVGDREGWTVPPELRGPVLGGSLWLTLSPKEVDPKAIARTPYIVFGDSLNAAVGRERSNAILALSPPDLNLPAKDVTQVRMRVLNLSSLSDYYLVWRTKERGWGDEPSVPIEKSDLAQSRRCTLRPDLKRWQEVTCFVDGRWQGTIEQIALVSGQWMTRGDLWIDSINITKGSPEKVAAKPDVASVNVVPRIFVDGISQADFARAFQTLSDALTTNVPFHGFGYPLITPGGYYSSEFWMGWAVPDTPLGAEGAQWTNFHVAEDTMRGLAEVQAQNPDGRIDGLGIDALRGQVGELSAFPALFQPAYNIARRTHDVNLRRDIYEMMRSYLDWWLSPVKRDERTGLVSAIFEETFGDSKQAPYLNSNTPYALRVEDPMTLAPVDTNVLIAVGAKRTAELAAALGKEEDFAHYNRVFQELARAINTYLWDEERGAYFNYDLKKGQIRPHLIVSTFDPLNMHIAPDARRDRLIKKMLDPNEFNWGTLPLTSWAKSEKGYVEAHGEYDGSAWFGDVWTIRNMAIVDGLEDSARPDLAAELNWATIKAFNNRYREYLVPSTGEGAGAEDYTWTAAQYIGAVIEHLFGIDVDAVSNRINIVPHVPFELYGKKIEISDLLIPGQPNSKIEVSILQTSMQRAKLTIRLSGPLPKCKLHIHLPGRSAEIARSAQRFIQADLH